MEYIVKETVYPLATKQEIVGTLTRCKDCCLGETDKQIPSLVHCNFFGKSMPTFGYCYLGEKKDE